MNKKDVHAVNMLPGCFVDVFAPDIKNIEISSNVFVDIEVVRDGSCIRIHIIGKPRVKQIIYDKMDDDGQ